MDPIGVMSERSVRWLYCLACQDAFELDARGRGMCRCKRSSAELVDGAVEVRGPAKVLAPLDEIVRAGGYEWAFVPEDIVVRRLRTPAA
jgi:hypothetical protein